MAASFIGVLLGLTLLGMAGCGGGGDGQASSQGPPPSAAATTSGFAIAPAVQQAEQANTPVSAALVQADNALGVDLLNLLQRGGTSNLAISPISIALAMQMTYNGAAGSTQQAMAQALQLQGLTTPALNEDNAALQAALVDPDPQVQLTIVNSLWMHLGDNPVSPAFQDINQQYYAAQIGDLAGAPSNINQWVSYATGGLITQIAPTDVSYANVVAVIANAVYFKGVWTSAFDPSQTSPAPFTRSDGTRVSCEMMNQVGNFGYMQTDSFQLVRLPYGQQNRISMSILLPQPGVSLNTIVGTLTAAQLNQWLEALDDGQTEQVSLGLPRFTTSYSTSLLTPLTTLGMGIAFTPEADFSALVPGSYISLVQHSTEVQVDETGTVAAASTLVYSTATFVQEPITFTADHPFLYLIRDDETGGLLFIGLMFNPTSS